MVLSMETLWNRDPGIQTYYKINAMIWTPYYKSMDEFILNSE